MPGQPVKLSARREPNRSIEIAPPCAYEGQEVDVASLPIEVEQVGLAKDLLDQGGHDPDMFIDLGEDLFLPGYPLGFACERFSANLEARQSRVVVEDARE